MLDPRSDFFSFAPAPFAPNGVVVDAVSIPCDPGTKVLANLYPCDGTVFNAGADLYDSCTNCHSRYAVGQRPADAK